MPPPPFQIPADVAQWIRQAFDGCNVRVTQKLDVLPTTHETSLDLSFVEALSQVSAPAVTPSGYTVRIDVHFLGGGRHFGTWEVADIGALVIYRDSSSIVRTKVALLQSKRLYPVEQNFEEDSSLTYQRGFGRLHESDQEFLRVTSSRRFSFLQRGHYAAAAVSDEQWRAIEGYERTHAIPVYYNLYHPSVIPWHVDLPLQAGAVRRPSRHDVGCRVVPASAVRSALSKKAVGYVPTFADLAKSAACHLGADRGGPGWRLEDFFVDELVMCNSGYIAGSGNDEGLAAVFTQRGAPIAAGIAVTISTPTAAQDEG